MQLPSDYGLFALVLLVVYLGEKIQQVAQAIAEHRQQRLLLKTISDALSRAQGVVPTPPAPQPIPASPVVPVPAPDPVPAPVTPSPAPAPTPTPSAWADFPPWFIGALHEVGFHETGNNEGIDKYIALAHTGSDGEPWCAIFANAMLEQAGITGTRSPSSQSFRTNANFVQLSGPAPGAIVVYWRISKSSGLGHVGFYRGEDAGRIWTLGGNENDMVCIEALPKDGASFGVLGYWWPKSVPLPTKGSITMPSGSPIQVTTDPTTGQIQTPEGIPLNQTGITATVFGGQQSAYGGPILDGSPGVALPSKFSGPTRPVVRVYNHITRQSVDCQIVDVGPWNIDDPYWTTGSRPQSESGIDMTGRKTNRAGIDLTIAAAQAAGIDGKGVVDWQFVPSSPSVT